MSPSPIRVVVADRGDARSAAALVASLERDGISVVGVASDADRAVELALETEPQVALIDLGIAGGGVSATSGIVGRAGTCRVVALARHEERGAILQMLLAGAIGYVVKGSPAGELTSAIRRAAAAEATLSTEVMTGLMIDLIREIGDRTESEARVRKNEQWFRALLEAAPDAVVIANEEGEIVLVNDRTEAMFGYERSSLLGQRIEFLLPERFHLDHIEHRMRYMTSPRTRRLGAVHGLVGRRMDGREIPVDIALSALATDEGSFVIAFVREVTTERSGGPDARSLIAHPG